MSAFVTYQQFPNAEVAQPLLELLSQHAIAYETGSDQASFDVTFANNAVNNHFLVKLRPEDFDAVRRLEDEHSRALAADVAPDHYLFAFSDEELFDILLRPEEWSRYDVTLARQILQQRGKEVSPEVMDLLRRRRNADLAQPEAGQSTWIMYGYFTAVLGGIVGLFIGWHLYAHRKTLPDGRQVPGFTTQDQRHGLRIMVLSAAGVVFWVLFRIYGPELYD
jgi:hypothetical protein